VEISWICSAVVYIFFHSLGLVTSVGLVEVLANCSWAYKGVSLMRHLWGNSGPGRAFSGVGDIMYLLVLVLDMVCLDADDLVGVAAGLLGWDALFFLLFPWEEDDIFQ
jgi:hypothetical protein